MRSEGFKCRAMPWHGLTDVTKNNLSIKISIIIRRFRIVGKRRDEKLKMKI